MNEPVVDLSQVSLRYRIYHQRNWTLKEAAISYLKRQNSYSDLWALRDISMRMGKGEIIGIIGRNGSGKSSLLKIIAGVLPATKGQCNIKGRVAAMIELGAGFNPELTGRENLYLNGSIYGFSRREMDKRYGRIVHFAELEEFMDVPVKNYSSGMYARLGFSIVKEVDPDILIIDEILAVGDESFQRKCIEHFETLRSGGVTIILVTHVLETVKKYCQRVMVLNEGYNVFEGDPARAVEVYADIIRQVEEKRAETYQSLQN